MTILHLHKPANAEWPWIYQKDMQFDNYTDFSEQIDMLGGKEYRVT